jgi:hypothetical protein
MKEHIDSAMLSIEEDYKVCLRIIGRYYDYLDTCGLKEFNKFSKYRWSFDRDKANGYSYVCIRYGNSLLKKCLVKKRPYIEKDDLYKWVENKELVQEALDEAYQFIITKINTVKGKIEAIKEAAENYEEKLEDISLDYEKMKVANKKLGEEGLSDEEAESKPPQNRSHQKESHNKT